MSSYFKLIDAVDTSQTLNVARRKNGVVTYCHVKLEPGKKYELGDDDIFIRSLKNATVKKSYSKELANQLATLGVPYKEEFCKTCGGRVKKVSYAIVEVVE